MERARCENRLSPVNTCRSRSAWAAHDAGIAVSMGSRGGYAVRGRRLASGGTPGKLPGRPKRPVIVAGVDHRVPQVVLGLMRVVARWQLTSLVLAAQSFPWLPQPSSQ